MDLEMPKINQLVLIEETSNLVSNMPYYLSIVLLKLLGFSSSSSFREQNFELNEECYVAVIKKLF